jgi:hypothetical protein
VQLGGGDSVELSNGSAARCCSSLTTRACGVMAGHGFAKRIGYGTPEGAGPKVAVSGDSDNVAAGRVRCTSRAV